VARFTPTARTTGVTDAARCTAGACYELELTVEDGRGGVDTDRVFVVGLSRAPSVLAPPSVAATAGVAIDVVAAVDDADGDALQLRWRVVDEPAGTR